MRHARTPENWLIHKCGKPSFNGEEWRTCPESEPITVGTRVMRMNEENSPTGIVRRIRKTDGAHVSRTLAMVDWELPQGDTRQGRTNEFVIGLEAC